MNLDEQVGTLFVGDRGTLFQGDERVVTAGHDDFASGVLFEKFLELQPDIQHHRFLQQSGGADGSRVVAAVPRIDDDPADFEAQGARQGARTRLGGGRRPDGGGGLRPGGVGLIVGSRAGFTYRPFRGRGFIFVLGERCHRGLRFDPGRGCQRNSGDSFTLAPWTQRNGRRRPSLFRFLTIGGCRGRRMNGPGDLGWRGALDVDHQAERIGEGEIE